MYILKKDYGTFIYKINNLEYPFYKVLLKGSEWIKVLGDKGSGDYEVRLRSKDGITVADFTHEEFIELFERVK